MSKSRKNYYTLTWTTPDIVQGTQGSKFYNKLSITYVVSSIDYTCNAGHDLWHQTLVYLHQSLMTIVDGKLSQH